MPELTRLHIYQDPILPGLRIDGPESILSPACRAVLRDRLRDEPGTIVIVNLPGEDLLVVDVGPELRSALIATVGPYSLEIRIAPHKHDTIMVLRDGREVDPPPSDEDATLLGGHYGRALRDSRHAKDPQQDEFAHRREDVRRCSTGTTRTH